jgi:hypothetical protein
MKATRAAIYTRVPATPVSMVFTEFMTVGATFASRSSCHASGLTVAHLLGHSTTSVLPAYVKPLDENTRALIAGLDAARKAHKPATASIQ